MFPFADGLVAEIEKKITEAFEVFDRESNKTVDVRFVNIFTNILQNLNRDKQILNWHLLYQKM